MKKKVIFAIATSLFALAMVFNMNLLEANGAGDVSLDGIAVMAQAQSENGGGGGINNKSETTATKKITVSYKWDATLKAWVLTASGSGERTEEVNYSYPCCVTNNGKSCSVGVDC